MSRAPGYLAMALAAIALVAAGGCAPLSDPLARGSNDPSPSSDSLADAERMDRIAALLEDGDYDEAKRQLDEALAAGYEHPRAFYLAARFETVRGDDSAAIPWYQETIARSPLWLEPRLELAQAYLAVERPMAAQGVFVELERLFPEHPAGPYGQAVIALNRGSVDEAHDLLRQSLLRAPDYPPALSAMAALARQAGDAEAEEGYLRRFLAQVPRNADAWARLAALEESAGRLDDAARSLRRAMELQPTPGLERQLEALEARRAQR